jgi:hypothetical protein
MAFNLFNATKLCKFKSPLLFTLHCMGQYIKIDDVFTVFFYCNLLLKSVNFVTRDKFLVTASLMMLPTFEIS